MKTLQLVEIENVKGANRALKNLLERTRTELVGLGLFYGKAGVGKTRWAMKTAYNNGYIYHRLEQNMTTKDFISGLLSKLLQNTMPFYEVKGNKNEMYQQVLEILQRNQDIVVIVDEADYGFRNKSILATIRDWVDESLATFVLVAMDKAKEKMQSMHGCYLNRTNCIFEFKPLNLSETEKIINEICEVSLDDEIKKFIHAKSNGTIRIVTKYIDIVEMICKKLKKTELCYNDIKDIITTVDVK